MQGVNTKPAIVIMATLIRVPVSARYTLHFASMRMKRVRRVRGVFCPSRT